MSDEIRVDGIFDAKLIRENKSAKGIFLTLEIAADDYFAAKLSDVRPGALLKIGYQEIVDVSVQPLEDSRGGQSPPLTTVPRPQANEAGISKPKKRFEDYSLAQQCGMRCDEEEFMNFFDTTYDRRLEDSLAEAVRRTCGVTSRSEIKPGTPAGGIWLRIENEYQNWLTDQRHAESVRR